MSKAKLEFIARIITEDGREIECKEVQNIPSPENVNIGSVNSFL